MWSEICEHMKLTITFKDIKDYEKMKKTKKKERRFKKCIR